MFMEGRCTMGLGHVDYTTPTIGSLCGTVSAVDLVLCWSPMGATKISPIRGARSGGGTTTTLETGHG